MGETDNPVFDASYAERYDDVFPVYEEASIRVLTELAQGGPVLELGIGTGRVALPLIDNDLDVYGIDNSEEMLSKLHAKPKGKKVRTHFGDFRNFNIANKFKLIFCVLNTFFLLLSQEEQLECFECVSHHLMNGGSFLIEGIVPDLRLFSESEFIRPIEISSRAVKLDVWSHDVVAQRVSGQHIFISDGSIQQFPIEVRYAWPSELDLMARVAGLNKKERWGSWAKEPFTARSRRQICLYQKD